jgi:hypothetical protein
MVDVGILAPEKTAFIAYNIGVYESVQNSAILSQVEKSQ